jgi:hypothetical protein
MAMVFRQKAGEAADKRDTPPSTAFLDARRAATYKPRHSFNRGWYAR